MGKTYDTATQSATGVSALLRRHENTGAQSQLLNFNLEKKRKNKKRKERRLTKGTNELSLHRPGDRLDEGGRREASEQHVVQEDDVEVAEPVIPTIVSQQIKAGDP